jgi:hypothetical protein
MNGGVLAAPGSTTPATVADVVNTPISRAFKALRALIVADFSKKPQGLGRNRCNYPNRVLLSASARCINVIMFSRLSGSNRNTWERETGALMT